MGQQQVWTLFTVKTNRSDDQLWLRCGRERGDADAGAISRDTKYRQFSYLWLSLMSDPAAC